MLSASQVRRAASRPGKSKMPRNIITLSITVLLLVAGNLSAESRRDYLMIVGSTTIQPMSQLVIKRIMQNSDLRAPMMQPTGSGGGLSLFCNGNDELDPDITLASRPIRQSELEKCKLNGVNEIVEVKIGYDGVIFAQSRDATPIELTRYDIYRALAKWFPNPDEGEPLIANPHSTWKDVNADFPDIPIEVRGPSKGSGTRYILERLAMEEGCRIAEGMVELEDEDPWQYRLICRTIRDDAAYVEVGENDELNLDALTENANALVIVSYGVLEAHEDLIRPLTIDGIAPDFEAIRNGSYLISRPLYLYARKSSANLYPGFREFLAEFTSEEAWSKSGYLRPIGLVPMLSEERKKYAEVVKALTPMDF
ncbi:MAG: phosphate ABC transporter substrate-binding protein [Gammaproteobacteria bacterium]|nr:MAG: phosphate ABC transporter substrate-binding protein [Gammaproteobacteria bacterium]RLA33713.1 MAG: phosphate ABC transporter substrate-binding protein [Gammaproteobacteria bacterium]